MWLRNKPTEEGSVLAALIKSHVETRDIGVVGPVDGMNNLSAEGPYFRIVLMKGDNANRSGYLISRGAAEELRDTLAALLSQSAPKPSPLYTDEFFDSFEA